MIFTTTIERAHATTDAIIERGGAAVSALRSQNERLSAARSYFSSTNEHINDTYALVARTELVSRRRHARIVAASVCTILCLYALYAWTGEDDDATTIIGVAAGVQ